VLWTQTLTGELSSPVVDAAGNVYVQGVALKSFTSAGTLRWTADTLGMVGPPVGAPSALANGTIVVPCLGEVCEVNASTGALVFRTSLGGGVTEAIAVGSDGTFYVVRQPASGNGELLALWSHTLPVLAGWPTEGHDMQRSRRQD
jgi:outer membrane protein assembly factor BamB